MEDFDIFTNKIEFTNAVYKSTLNKLVFDGPSTPINSNYESGRKLLAEGCLAEGDEAGCAFHLSESVSTSIRTMATYRDEQSRAADDKLYKIKSCVKPIKDITNTCPVMTNEDETLFDMFSYDIDEVVDILDKYEINEELPFHKQYLKFTKVNNVDNFLRILNELPKEWTVVQLTTPYNPNENLMLMDEYSRDISSLMLSVFTNDYLDDMPPFTIRLPANVTKEGEKPLFTELFSILEENYKTIDNAQFLNNKRLVQNYWNRREDIDLRMKSVINVMDKEWIGGFGCLLTGKLLDSTIKGKIVKLVEDAIADWGFIKLTKKQRVLLYNLVEGCPPMTSHQIKSCVRRILTEHGNTEDVKRVLQPCDNCTKEFTFTNELCLKCLSECFQAVHHFSLVDGIRAFSQVVAQVKDGDEWAMLRRAKRHPVILIVDELLDIFPWESLGVLCSHPASRVENIHFLYHLYKTHESRIIDGHYVTTGEIGRYVINPEKNLDRMEKRMHSFVEYWCETWRGHVGETPTPQDFIQYLRTADIFLYCGHGDGCQLASGGGGGVEAAAGARGVCVLAGCGSVRLRRTRARRPPHAQHRRMHLAGCPTIVGMLWEVTDLEVDKVVTTLLALHVPSKAPLPWASVGKTDWSKGQLDLSVQQKGEFITEPELLRAVCRARGSTSYLMIASSVVVRGLPSKIQKNT